MKIKFTKEEILTIVENHLIERGFKTSGVEIIHIDKKEYEYYGDPTREDRREVTRKYFDGIEAVIEFESQ